MEHKYKIQIKGFLAEKKLKKTIFLNLYEKYILFYYNK